MKSKIAIIGAGIAGLTLANRLIPHADVVIFEKARGVGGRMSNRSAEPFNFDHGTQFFTARNKRFENFLSPYLGSGLIQEWKGKVVTFDPGKKMSDRLWFEPHYVACPTMNSLCKQMAEGIEIHLNCEVSPLKPKLRDGWELVSASQVSLGTFDLVISTAPPVQTVRLFDEFLSAAAQCRQSQMLACYTLMIGYRAKWARPWIAARINNSAVEWVSVNSSKPGRDQHHTSIVVNSTNVWAQQHVDDDQNEVQKLLSEQLKGLLDLDVYAADYRTLHRWRYAVLEKAHDDDSRQRPFYDKELKLASVGDWGSRSRIEDVWVEANLLADQILT